MCQDPLEDPLDYGDRFKEMAKPNMAEMAKARVKVCMTLKLK
jgi:hypothetical protein